MPVFLNPISAMTDAEPGNAEAPFLLVVRDVSALYSLAMPNTTSLFRPIVAHIPQLSFEGEGRAISPTGNFHPSADWSPREQLGRCKQNARQKIGKTMSEPMA